MKEQYIKMEVNLIKDECILGIKSFSGVSSFFNKEQEQEQKQKQGSVEDNVMCCKRILYVTTAIWNVEHHDSLNFYTKLKSIYSKLLYRPYFDLEEGPNILYSFIDLLNEEFVENESVRAAVMADLNYYTLEQLTTRLVKVIEEEMSS
jgi:hypothetical protein